MWGDICYKLGESWPNNIFGIKKIRYVGNYMDHCWRLRRQAPISPFNHARVGPCHHCPPPRCAPALYDIVVYILWFFLWICGLIFFEQIRNWKLLLFVHFLGGGQRKYGSPPEILVEFAPDLYVGALNTEQ